MNSGRQGLSDGVHFFHIYVWIYSGSSRSIQAMVSWSRKKKSQDWKWILQRETSMALFILLSRRYYQTAREWVAFIEFQSFWRLKRLCLFIGLFFGRWRKKMERKEEIQTWAYIGEGHKKWTRAAVYASHFINLSIFAYIHWAIWPHFPPPVGLRKN